MTKPLQSARRAGVSRRRCPRRSAATSRSLTRLVQHTGARLDRMTPAQLRRYHLFLLERRWGTSGAPVRIKSVMGPEPDEQPSAKGPTR